MYALNLEDIYKNFDDVEVLKGVTLDLEEGGFLVLLGPSGCGKSTLLNMIAGLETIDSGVVKIGGKVANKMYPKDRDIAMVFQSYALYPSMTVRRNMGFGLEMRGTKSNQINEQVEKAAELLKIGPLLDRKPSQLSGGQRQRVAMGRAIVREPELFLFDEPLSNLDAKLRTKMRSEMKKLHKRLNASIVYVTHDQVEAMTLATKVAIMSEGEVEQVGPPNEVYNDPNNMFVAGFLGAPPMNFAHGQISASGYGIEVEGLKEAIPLPKDFAKQTPGRKVVAGFRPEAISEYQKASKDHWDFQIAIDVTEPMGADTMIHFMFGEDEITGRLGGKQQPESGDSIHLAVSKEDIYLFDQESADRIRH